MIVPKLTKPARPAHTPSMWGRRRAMAGAIVVLGSALAGGCISVNAPNEPIVIERAYRKISETKTQKPKN